MKIRNHKKFYYIYFPSETSSIQRSKTFKYKSDLIKYLNRNFPETLNGTVRLEQNSFGRSGAVREYFVWYNDYREKNQKLKIVLKQQDFRGRKFIYKKDYISKDSKKYFAFSNKVIYLMCHIKNDQNQILPKDAKKLVELFYKRGFKDFIPEQQDQDYIDYYIENGIDFYHWSDRCNWLRTKTIIEYFKTKQLLD